MAKKRPPPKTAPYLQWLASQKLKKLSPSDINRLDAGLRRKVVNELAFLKSLPTKEYNLWHKYNEVRDWLPRQKQTDIKWVKRLLWRPKGKSDFRRIEPELLFVGDGYELVSKNIWGETRFESYPNDEPIAKHWEIIRTLVSSGRNDGTVGRAIRFLVRDKPTKTYLGVICLSSSMALLTARNKAIGWDIKKNFVKGGKLTHLANGQTIVPTQPFGSAFLGGKLLSLLCLSDVVANTWKREYGQTLVEVDTTSLHGQESQYDNLNPYWQTKLGETTGITPLKPSDSTFEAMREWMRQRFPDNFYEHFVETNASGVPAIRENKTSAINFCYKKLDINSDAFTSDQKRGVYRSCLYSNGDAFLRDELAEDQLIPAFDNSVEALTKFWQFGLAGDTTALGQSGQIPDNQKKRQRKKLEMKGMVKGRIDARFSRTQIATEGPQVEWYESLNALTWAEARARFAAPPAHSQTSPEIPAPPVP